MSTAEGIQFYSHRVNQELSNEHRQNIANDLVRYQNADNIWEVLREEFTLDHYEHHPAVQAKIKWWLNNQDFLLRSASRSAPYLHYILKQVKKKHLPAELVLLPIVESGYNPFAYSNMGAAGIWQMMPGTASGFKIRQDSWYDGRRDVIASTRAALNYLAYLQNFFDGNWLLAIAAYNTGEGNILSAIKRNLREGRGTDFWSLPVAQETKEYIPSLLALAIIINHPERYPVYFPPVRNAPYLAQVEIPTQMNLKYAAHLAGISHKHMVQLNPGFNRGQTAPGSNRLVLPIQHVEQFIENMNQSPYRPTRNWKHYNVKSGDTLPILARRFNTSQEQLKKMNNLARNKLKANTTLLVPHRERENPDHLASSLIARMKEKKETYTIRPGDTIYLTRSKDTLESIAKRFHVNVEELRFANRLKKTSRLSSGKQIIIPTHGQEKPVLKPTLTASKNKKNKTLRSSTIHSVKRGDTLQKLAKKYRKSEAEIRLANLGNLSFKPGDQILIP